MRRLSLLALSAFATAAFAADPIAIGVSIAQSPPGSVVQGTQVKDGLEIVKEMYFAMLALGWNLLAGFTGQFSLAPAAFAMLGAYATALLDYHAKAPLAIGIPAAIAGTAVLGWLLGRVVLRLKGPYLALTTLSFAEIARVVIGNSHEFTRGDQGLNVPGLMSVRMRCTPIFHGTYATTSFAIRW